MMNPGIDVETLEKPPGTEGDGVRRASDYSRRMAATEDAPDFAAEWRQIRKDLEDERVGALRIGQNLSKIRDALKPRGLWLRALREHGMSQPQASRYIRFAALPERDRAAFQRGVGFSLGEAIGERRRKKGAGDVKAELEGAAEKEEIPADELGDRRAEVDRRLKLAVAIVEAGAAALVDGPQPSEYADDTERWRNKVREVADDVLAVIDGGLEAELKKRLLPGLE